MALDPLPQQRLAIEAPLGPVLVVAGPGAGKTFCLIARINYLINTRGLAPERICAVTFTNRAAEEIAVRLTHTLGERAEAITRGTIHALCLAQLREHAEAAGLKKGFGVADEQYQKVILGRLHVPLEQRGSLLNRFSRHRVQKQDYELTPDDARLYREYTAWLAHRNMVDFDDLVAKAEELLRTRGDIADAIAARWDYLLVDEFQDVNAVQYDLLKRLAAPHGNFFAVGDDEQSIFTWTGADPYVLVRFSRDYEIDRPIILDKNCRCSRQIFETARRVLAQNPQLFEKQLSAEQESAYEVGAFAFRDEEEEAAWLLEDILADRAVAGLGWGDYAILYRRHKVGEYLEGRLVRAGIPCRLARGRSLVEDDVIKYVIAALGIVRDPGDPVALEAFARCVLSVHFLQEVEAAIGNSGDFLTSVRALARRRPAQDPDTKKLWRLVFQVENLRALARSHRALAPLVDEILSQSVGPYKNALEERHDELTDPADLAEAVTLAARLGAAIAAEQDIVIEPQGGLEIALRGMLAAAGVRHVPSSTNFHQPPPTSIPSPLILFKALQLLHAKELDTPLERYVTFDLETTDKDVDACEVVEVGAVRVVGGEIVDRFHTLVKPYRPITPGATKVHGYTDAAVREAPSFAEVWPEFRAFIGDDVLIAHNGQHFDVPVLRRLAAGRDGVDSLVFYDTLPLVRSLSRDSAKLEDLALRFGIDAGRAHHALDDAVTLARVYRELERLRGIRARKAVLVNLLDYLGLGLALEPEAKSGEQDILFKLAKFYTLGRYGDALAFYEMERERTGEGSAPPVDEVIRRLGGRALMTRLRAEPDPAQRYPAAVARLRALIDEPSPAGTLRESIDRLLDRVALSTSEGIEVAPDRVNLLTLHSTKGLEFSRVYIVGVEDYQIPGLREAKENRQAEIQEARRLLYVGMTRTRERLVLTRVERRFGMEAGGSSFLEEMGLEADAVGAG
ncbi:MAG TPA: UvrD-helicase domain-containing protein [Gemmatimonadales bacterium]|nr:UvrD-helicase domain-containing protein [Gemmatimonadales bacterium]